MLFNLYTTAEMDYASEYNESFNYNIIQDITYTKCTVTNLYTASMELFTDIYLKKTHVVVRTYLIW